MGRVPGASETDKGEVCGVITRKGLNIEFCCGFMLDKVLTNRVQLIEAGDGKFWCYNGPMEGWDSQHLKRCPAFKCCPYCEKRINEP